MKISEVRIGQKVRFENQKWLGIVQGICDKFDEVSVIFEGDGALEFIDAQFLRAVN
jgi:hypothetical protein